MNRRGATQVLACVLLVAAGAGAAEARQSRDPFARGTVSLECDAAVLSELWHLNERRESIVEGAASVWGAVADGLSIGVEFHHFHVNRAPQYRIWVFAFSAEGAKPQGLSLVFSTQSVEHPRVTGLSAHTDAC